MCDNGADRVWRSLIERIRNVANDAGVKARLVSRRQVRKAFAPVATKREIAVALVERFPEIAPILPPPRKLPETTTEDARMNVFDAVALAITPSRNRNIRITLGDNDQDKPMNTQA